MQPLFEQFFLGGFEASSHRLRNGKRLDVIGAIKHDAYAFNDYQLLQRYNITTVRDGLRWHLIEKTPGVYDWSSVLPMLRAARDTQMQVIWDICHYGWPDDLDIWEPAFVTRLTAFARAFATLVANETDAIPFYAPVNEISFFSWGGGDVAYLNPFANGRGFELKTQLARAAIEATEAIWSVDPRARIVHTDPMIHIAAPLDRPDLAAEAESHRLAQFQGWDLLSGRLWPQIGGDPKYLDIIGVNYYSNNQWIHTGPPIDRFHPQYRPLRYLLREVVERYDRPTFVAETGCEFDERPAWLRYVSGEVQALLSDGIPIEGICLYPIMNHPGWDDDRHCQNGLFDYANTSARRDVYVPLAQELRYQSDQINKLRSILTESADFLDVYAVGSHQ